MTRAADRLIVGGCMPGNMNAVRKFSWYDLIVKGLGNSSLHLHEFDTRDGVVKRYARPEDVAGPAATVAATNGNQPRPRCRRGCRTPAPTERLAGRLAAPLRSADPADDEQPSRPRPANRSRSALARCSAARWSTGCCNPLPDIASERRRDAALAISPAMLAPGPQGSRGAGAKLLDLIADARFAPVILRPAAAPRVSIVGRLDRREATSAGFGADRPAGADAGRNRDRRLQDQSRPAGRRPQAAPTRLCPPVALALYRAVRCRSSIPGGRVRAALLWTETPLD